MQVVYTTKHTDMAGNTALSEELCYQKHSSHVNLSQFLKTV